MSVINTNQLKSALERLCLVVPKRGTLPVLENLRWRAANGHLGLTATDLDNHLHISIPFIGEAIDSDVDALVPAKEFCQLVKTESTPSLKIESVMAGVRSAPASAQSFYRSPTRKASLKPQTGSYSRKAKSSVRQSTRHCAGRCFASRQNRGATAPTSSNLNCAVRSSALSAPTGTACQSSKARPKWREARHFRHFCSIQLQAS